MLLAWFACLPSHPVMNSINLNLFKASVGETTAFVVVSAVHSRTGLGPGAASRGYRQPVGFLNLSQKQPLLNVNIGC